MLRLSVLFALSIAFLAIGACGRADARNARDADVLRHLVGPGETLSGIARRYQIPVSDLIRANGLHSRLLEQGQVLLVPGGVLPPAPKAAPAAIDPSLFAARSSWSSGSIDLTNIDPMEPRPYRVTVHHTGDAVDLKLTGPELLQRIERQHNGRDFACIGYHFVISGDGRIWEGRPACYQGAHAGGDNNRGNIGIAVAGNFDRQQVSPQVRDSLTRLLNALCDCYEIKGTQITGHDHFKITECPGQHLHGFLQGYKSVARR
jgi:hypothetical protein